MSNEENAEIIETNEEEEQKYCWVCFATDEEDRQAQWVHPCKCRGTSKWVHQLCLQRWVDEKQKGGVIGKVLCPLCQTEYIVEIPNMGALVYVLDVANNVVLKSCPFLAAGFVLGGVYWTAVTYGAITVMQVVGHREGLAVMEQADPLVLLIGLPAIPVALIVGKTVRWEDTVLRFIRRHLVNVPLIKYVLPFRIDVTPALEPTPETEVPPLTDTISATRIMCGALLLPTFANLFGRIFFDSVKSNFHRTVLGGLAFIAVKGAFRIYHKQQTYIRQCQRKILDYTDSNVAMHLHQNYRSNPPNP